MDEETPVTEEEWRTLVKRLCRVEEAKRRLDLGDFSSSEDDLDEEEEDVKTGRRDVHMKGAMGAREDRNLPEESEKIANVKKIDEGGYLQESAVLDEPIIPYWPIPRTWNRFKQDFKIHPKRGFIAPLWCVIPIVAFLVFVNGLSGGLVYDDSVAIAGNTDLRPTTPITDLFRHDFWGNPINEEGVWTNKSYRPFTVMSFRLNYILHGLEPFGYHLVNVIAHAFITLLVYCTSRVILVANPNAKLISYITAGFFAVHPIHTDAIDSIVGRAEVLYMIAYLLSFLFYVKGSQAVVKWRYIAASVGCFVVSCWCKEMGVTVIALCFGWDLLYNFDTWNGIVACYKTKQVVPALKRSWENGGKLLAIRGLILVAALISYFLHRMYVVGGFAGLAMQKHHNPIAFETGWNKWRTVFYVHTVYTKLLLFPVWLSADYSMSCVPIITEWADPLNFVTLGLYIALAVTLVLVLRSRKYHKELLMGFAWIIIPFLPAAQVFFAPGTVVAERVLYLPSLGYCFLLAWFLSFLVTDGIPQQLFTTSKKKKSGKTHNKLAKFRISHKQMLTLVFVILAAYSAKTVQQNPVWATQLSLFENAAHVCPNSGKALFNYAAELEMKYLEDEAKVLYERSFAIDSSYSNAAGRLGKIQMKHGNLRKALEYYASIVNTKAKSNGKLWHEFAYHDAGYIYWKLGEISKATSFLQFAAKIAPKGDRYEGDAENNLGCMYIDLDENFKAIESLKAAVAKKPSEPIYWSNLGLGYWKVGRKKEAIEAVERAYKLGGSNHKAAANYFAMQELLLDPNAKAPLNYSVLIRP
eukprot:TRINITY_DN10479_c0_g1_i1.p1 TRINITY_DN10479_c0_g1~~TRINITY_DN10479_c0_g1_i1.p1  ORF type:complete len:819 (+),score=109.58 TRINITY_DN10479_c0_g1_i1:34-2457(+)